MTMDIQVQTTMVTKKQWVQTVVLGVVPLPGFTPDFHVVFHVI